MDKEEIKVKLLAETAQVSWHEIEKFFARGVLLQLSSDCDLVEIATQMACDESESISKLMQEKKIMELSLKQAKSWSEDDDNLWAVVVSPWVIVQQRCKTN